MSDRNEPTPVDVPPTDDATPTKDPAATRDSLATHDRASDPSIPTRLPSDTYATTTPDAFSESVGLASSAPFPATRYSVWPRA